MVRFDTYNASAHFVRQLEKSGRVAVVHDGGDNLLVQLVTGELISIYLIETVMPPYEIHQTLVDNNTAGIHSLFVLWGEMFLSENGTVLIPDEWIRALYSLYGDKIYAFGVYGKDIHIFPVYFDRHGYERVLRYGDDVNVAHLAGGQVSLNGFDELRGTWLIADFGGHKAASHQAASHQRHTHKAGNVVHAHKTGTPWEILGIAPSSDRETVKQAYRRLARLYHPDINRSKDAHDQMRTLNQAYETLVRELDEHNRHSEQH